MYAAIAIEVADSVSDSRWMRVRVCGPPAAIAPTGVLDPAHATRARARGVGPVTRTAESSASISTSSCTQPSADLLRTTSGKAC